MGGACCSPLERKAERYEWYFGIGVMMNQVTIKARKIFPVESQPAEILEYKLTFFGEQGLACAEPAQGESFHGVLHKLKEEDMYKMDQIEANR